MSESQRRSAAQRSGFMDLACLGQGDAAQRSAAICYTAFIETTERSAALWILFTNAVETLASGAPSASLPRSGRFARSLRALVSLASGASFGRVGRSARSLSAGQGFGPRAVRSLRSLTALGPPALACVGRSLRALRSLALRALRSIAWRPPLSRSAASARSLPGFRSGASRPSLWSFVRALSSLAGPSTSTSNAPFKKTHD